MYGGCDEEEELEARCLDLNSLHYVVCSIV